MAGRAAHPGRRRRASLRSLDGVRSPSVPSRYAAVSAWEDRMKDFHGRVAVVTGAASGIGRGMCEAFVEAGMRVVLSDVEQPALERTKQILRAGVAEEHGVATDVAKPEQVEALADETLRHYGAVHVVCHKRV